MLRPPEASAALERDLKLPAGYTMQWGGSFENQQRAMSRLAVIVPLTWWFVVDRIAPLGRRAPWWIAGLLVTAPWPLVAGALA